MVHICPIEGTLINEPTVRFVAGIVAITAAVGIYFLSPIVFLFLAFDLFVRGFNKKDCLSTKSKLEICILKHEH